MSWTNKGGGGQGPWGSKPLSPRPGAPKPGGPSGGGPRRPGGGEPPRGGDFDRLLQNGQDGLRRLFAPGNGRGIVLALAGIVVLWLASGLYRIDAGEQGIVLRFGAYARTTPAGLHYHLPAPIESVRKVDVETTNAVKLGSQAERGRYSAPISGASEGEMLTGDMNIVEISFEVQWKVKAMEAEKYLFNVRDAAETVKPVADSAMREVVGQLKLQDILTTAQGEIATRTQDIIQHTLDRYDAGIEILSVNLSKPDVPDEVVAAFQDVKKAEQDRETTVSVAERYRNEIMPKAGGEAAKMEQEALAYKSQALARAQGEVSRFLAVYTQYKAAPDVTKQRLYLETMEEVLSGMPKMILETNGVAPYLPLPGMRRAGEPAGAPK